MTTAFYLASIVGAPALFMVVAWLAPLWPAPRGHDVAAAAQAWSMVASFYAYGVAVYMWFRAWRALADGDGKFRPGRMALFLLIPLFNLYWFFRAVWGWARAYNGRLRERRLNAPPANEGLFLTYCIFTVAAAVANPGHIARLDFPGDVYVLALVGQALKAAQLCFDVWLVWAVCTRVNALAGAE